MLSFTAALSLLLIGFLACNTTNANAMVLPLPEFDEKLASAPTEKTAVVAGGCFWGIQAVFQHLKGVKSAVSGYSGGSAENASYELVGSGNTGHAESVQITYDASQISYGQLLRIFFSVAHDPTEMNRQGPDVGSQYRSAIFFADAEQHRIAEDYIAQLTKAKSFSRPIATQVVPLVGFYPAESYHQNYASTHPNQPYIMIHDAPKVMSLQKLFPQMYTEQLAAAESGAGLADKRAIR